MMKESFFKQESEKKEGRELLRELESTGNYVFHGSPNRQIDEFELRQPMHFEQGIEVQDGDPCVAATRFADLAIFRALTQNENGYSSFGVQEDGSVYCAADAELIHSLEGATGAVYVFLKNRFKPWSRSGVESVDDDVMEWRSSVAQRPDRIIRVDALDLPKVVLMKDEFDGK